MRITNKMIMKRKTDEGRIMLVSPRVLIRYLRRLRMMRVIYRQPLNYRTLMLDGFYHVVVALRHFYLRMPKKTKMGVGRVSTQPTSCQERTCLGNRARKSNWPATVRVGWKKIRRSEVSPLEPGTAREGRKRIVYPKASGRWIHFCNF